MVTGLVSWLRNIYDKEYRKLLLIPLLIILASVAIIAFNYAATGEFFKKDVSLKGGITITVFSEKSINAGQLQGELSSGLKRDVAVRILSQSGSQTGFSVEAEGNEGDVSVVLDALQSRIGKLDSDEYSVQVIGSTLSESFLKDAGIALLAAFFLMGIVVLVYFRALVPSLFVISAAFSDILSTFAVMVFLNERLSTAGLAAFLMLIGYSVDTDILLTSRVLRGKEGTVFERTIGAMKTGLFMTLTALAATVAGLLFAQAETIRQIMLVLSIGLVFDMIHTWLTNAGILRWYLERRKAKESAE
ncbi:MMPL family transporter [Candidatus Woesearchaeota archaeon]|nr:MMPL family transporter [Candidatus Woesearchaeota archaeon]